MGFVAGLLVLLVAAIHVYIFLLETVLFKTRGKKIFRIEPNLVDRFAVAFSNQGLYNLFLAAALFVGLLHPNPVVGSAFTVFGLLCVAVAGVWGAATVMTRILYIQTAPAMLALLAVWLF